MGWGVAMYVCLIVESLEEKIIREQIKSWMHAKQYIKTWKTKRNYDLILSAVDTSSCTKLFNEGLMRVMEFSAITTQTFFFYYSRLYVRSMSTHIRTFSKVVNCVNVHNQSN